MSGVPYNTIIRTPNGWKPICDIKIDDYVITRKGTYSKVLATYDTGMRNLCRFTFSDGRQVDTAYDHAWDLEEYTPVSRWKGKSHPKIIVADELRRILNRGCRSLYYIDFPQPEISSDKDLPLDPYFLGILLASGYYKGKNIGFIGDSYIFETIRDLLPEDCLLGKPYVDRNELLHVKIIHNPEVSEQWSLPGIIQSLGLDNNSNRDRFVPAKYFDGSHVQRLSLIQGILDGRGRVGNVVRGVKSMTDNSIAEITTYSMQFCDDLIYLVRSIGGLCTDTQRYFKYTQCGLEKGCIYKVQISVEFGKTIFRTPYKRDKVLRINPFMKKWKLRIAHADLLPFRSPCVDLLLEDTDNTFVTRSFVVLQGMMSVD